MLVSLLKFKKLSICFHVLISLLNKKETYIIFSRVFVYFIKKKPTFKLSLLYKKETSFALSLQQKETNKFSSLSLLNKKKLLSLRFLLNRFFKHYVSTEIMSECASRASNDEDTLALQPGEFLMFPLPARSGRVEFKVTMGYLVS